MALRNKRTSAREKEIKKSPIGAVRRAQLITTYGVGSLIAMEDKSYIVSGLDTWKDNSRWGGALYEPRLQHWLGVTHFQLPPADVPTSGNGVKVRMFPTMYSCGTCQVLQQFRRFNSPEGKSICGACEKPLIPSRFVVACEQGHLDEFPYFEWVHKKTAPDAAKEHRLTLHSTGRTASLRSVVVRCSCGKEASLQGAFGRSAMEALGIRCSGRRPWLGLGTEQNGCPAAPRTLQRGSSAAWFPINRSALSIPPWSDSLQQRLNEHYAALNGAINDGVPEHAVLNLIKNTGMLKNSRFTAKEVLDAIYDRRTLESSARPDSDAEAGFEPANELRKEEYQKLFDGTANADRGDDFECVPPERDRDVPPPPGIQRVMLVKRLREVRAMQSFTRVEMPDPAGGDTRKAALFTGDIDWLPAIEVSGEGVFFTLDQHLLRQWERCPGPVQRAGLIKERHEVLLRRRARGDRPLDQVRSPVSPRYLLLHTLAHILINEWSLDSGYPAASLRERLYVSDDMAGVLIYTATSDSAGSLGGIVAQGEHRRLRTSLASALSRASWCSQDPPCMESEASGVDSLNLAACYACVLLPETSCETNNVFLDRAVLVGTPDDPQTGFFQSSQ
ncbi:hypothetical protein FHU36_001760 [Nonomuraea muscovyensis]|uniref:MrfA-like Zn-binding domain-containing protein n=1 Tax=Nonomuraea muscovyensis TaxID=1124761 RepID=A0A7X0C1A0_9ACTN|nr:DUF1998 domain-containing protein [Nonomuraea muscovyensis]MBB6345251.1 hypothetical protein [Nonomuraea muscovyensis]